MSPRKRKDKSKEQLIKDITYFKRNAIITLIVIAIIVTIIVLGVILIDTNIDRIINAYSELTGRPVNSQEQFTDRFIIITHNEDGSYEIHLNLFGNKEDVEIGSTQKSILSGKCLFVGDSRTIDMFYDSDDTISKEIHDNITVYAKHGYGLSFMEESIEDMGMENFNVLMVWLGGNKWDGEAPDYEQKFEELQAEGKQIIICTVGPCDDNAVSDEDKANDYQTSYAIEFNNEIKEWAGNHNAQIIDTYTFIVGKLQDGSLTYDTRGATGIHYLQNGKQPTTIIWDYILGRAGAIKIVKQDDSDISVSDAALIRILMEDCGCPEDKAYGLLAAYKAATESGMSTKQAIGLMACAACEGSPTLVQYEMSINGVGTSTQSNPIYIDDLSRYTAAMNTDRGVIGIGTAQWTGNRSTTYLDRLKPYLGSYDGTTSHGKAFWHADYDMYKYELQGTYKVVVADIGNHDSSIESILVFSYFYYEAGQGHYNGSDSISSYSGVHKDRLEERYIWANKIWTALSAY